MCTRFVYNGNDTVVGFNFDIDLSVGTLLYVNENKKGKYSADARCAAISDLREQYVKGELSFDYVCRIAKNQEIVYAKDAAMQAMFSDRKGVC